MRRQASEIRDRGSGGGPARMVASRIAALLSAEHGASLLELAMVMPLLLLLLMGAVDFGRAYYLAQEIGGAAHAGAEYGAIYPTDTTGMRTAALNDAANVPGVSVSVPTYGCECSDTSTTANTNCTSTLSCSSNANIVYWVKVKVSATYKTWFPWPGIPSSMTLSRTAVMRSPHA